MVKSETKVAKIAFSDESPKICPKSVLMFCFYHLNTASSVLRLPRIKVPQKTWTMDVYGTSSKIAQIK